MGSQRKRPVDPDMPWPDKDPSPNAVVESRPAPKPFNPYPNEWRPGLRYDEPCEIWCYHDRQLEEWVPEDRGGNGLVRTDSQLVITPIVTCVVLRTEPAPRIGMFHVDFNAGLVPFLDWLSTRNDLVGELGADNKAVVGEYLQWLETQV